jgi:hypothetical protein
MRHRFFKISMVVRSIVLLRSSRTSTLVYDDVKRTAGPTVTVSEGSGRRLLLAKETGSDALVGATRHRARHRVVASVLCLCGITSRCGLV